MAFLSWLSENHGRFIVEPIVPELKEGSLKLSFQGVAPDITISIHGKGSIVVAVDYQGECWDLLTEFDVFPKRNSAGDYYCDQCLPGSIKYYRSRMELFKEHSFEPMLEWVNDHFRPDHWIMLFGKKNRMTWAVIVKEEDMEATKIREEIFVDAFPVISR